METCLFHGLNPPAASCPPPNFMANLPRKRKIKAKSEPDVTGVGAQLCPVFPILNGETLWLRPPGHGSAFCWDGDAMHPTRNGGATGKGLTGDGDAAGESPTGDGDATSEGPAGDPPALATLLPAWMQVLLSARLRDSCSWSVPKSQSDDRVIY